MRFQSARSFALGTAITARRKGSRCCSASSHAKAGQTGSVSSPQLHFEVRKGAVALDPMKFLSQNTASAN